MSYTLEDKFAKFRVSQSVEQSARNWDNAELFKSSYYQQSSKNVSYLFFIFQPLAMQNSTEQLLCTKSLNLKSISTVDDSKTSPLNNSNFISHDFNNLYRTSYNDMSSKLPKLLNTYYTPKYGGFVPGMKSENPFAACYPRLAKEQIDIFDNKRFGKETNVTYKQWKYNPLSRIYGNFWNNKEKRMTNVLQSSLGNHDYTTRLRDSGYSENLFPSKMNSGWLNPSFNSDMVRTEYRIQFNPKKEFHYKKPSFSTGLLKIKEKNYKHT